MSVALRTITRLQDADDLNVSLGVGVDEYALCWDNDTARFVTKGVHPGATVFVAANDASARSKSAADYVCDGTNDEVQIQAAIDALPTVGGKVLLSEGTFLLSWVGEITSDTLTTPYSLLLNAAAPPVALAGIPGATVLKLADSQPANTSMISLRGSAASPRTNPVHLSGIEFDGNKTAQPAWDNFADVSAVYASNITIDNCRFKNWKQNGFHAFRLSQRVCVTNSYFLGQGGLRLENHHYNVVGNIFEVTSVTMGVSNIQLVPDYDVAGYTSRLSSFIGNQFIGGSIQLEMNGTHGCTVMGNTFSGQSDPNDFAITMTTNAAGSLECKNNVVVGNTFYDCANAIRLSGAGSLGVKNNIIANNVVLDGPSRNMTYGLWEYGGTTGSNMLINNYCDSTIVNKIVANGNGTRVEGNLGYVTEKRGAAYVADGSTIAHGCAAAPSVVSVTGTVAGEILTVTSISATTFTLAIKQADGSAGTTQTVYWRAENVSSASQWYRAGGAPHPVAAYTPKGAASQAASYINGANPGVYDAAAGVAPSWNTATGWTFNGSTQYLTTTIVPTSTNWTMLVRITGATVGESRCVVGSRNGGNGFELWHSSATAGRGRIYTNGAVLGVDGDDLADAVFGFAGKFTYLNGASDGVIGAGTTLPTQGLHIGTSNGVDLAAYALSGTIAALVVYSSVLTPEQVAAVTSAMVAL